MDGITMVGRSAERSSRTGRPGTGGEPVWASRWGEGLPKDSDQGTRNESASLAAAEPASSHDFPEAELERLRREAVQAAHEDAAENLPAAGQPGPTNRESLLRERCRSMFERWDLGERRRVREMLTEREELTARLLGRTELLLDRFERLTNGVILLKARRSTRKERTAREDDGADRRRAGISTRVYLLAITFLGLVEFFANAPVFSTLLPRDPLTERQIDVLAETSSGWLAGAQRVLAQLVLRPDAALLAAGVITFLLVLAHFFGHSLRELVMRRAPQPLREDRSPRPILENAVPMVLTGIGLVLVLGVLFQARVILGDIGERRHAEDMQVVSELRRNAGWLRTDGELLQATQLTDQADDMEAAAARLREYAASMSRMTFPILLLNLTLVLAAVTAAYFHLRGRSVEEIDEEIFDESREGIAGEAESTANEIADLLSQARRPIRELQSLSTDGYAVAPRSVVARLESILATYRRENAAVRGFGVAQIDRPDSRSGLRLVADGEDSLMEPFRKVAAEALSDQRRLSERFKRGRDQLNVQLSSWEPARQQGSGHGNEGHRRLLSALAFLILAGPSVGCAGIVAEATGGVQVPELAIFVYDRSGSMPEYQLGLAEELTARRIRQLDYGDRIVAMELLEASLDEPPLRWSQDVPEREYPDMDVESDRLTRSRFLRDAAAYMERFTDAASREPSRGTDILSTLHDVAADLRANNGHSATLYLFSDMLQSNATLNFEDPVHEPPLVWIDRAAADGQLPDLEGLCVVVVGARTDTDAGQSVKQFWMRYFDAARAALYERNYQLRPVDLPAAPCES